jgi:hypothetical protein
VPLAGGSSDKYGNRYEDRWAAQCAFDVLRETSLAIRSEPPGAGGEGVEFWIDYPNRREYHQVKRQRSDEGRWTIRALQSAGVLEAFYDKLQQANAHCVFVSSHAAFTLEELSDRARKAESFAEYERDFLSSETWHAHFDDLRRCWGDIDPDWIWRALVRVRAVTLSEPELASSNGLAAELLLEGEYEPAVATLIAVLRDRVNERLTPHTLWQALAEQGIKPNTWSNAERAAVLLSDSNERYRESRRATLIGGQLVERPQVAELAGLLDAHPVVLLDGPAGMGKSDVLLGLSNLLLERKVPHLAFRLDRLAPTARPDLLGQELGLPASPPAVLAAVAQGEQSVLVIDQLDMVSTSSGRNPQFFECVGSLLRLAAAQPQMRVVLACRTFDLANDTRLRALVHGQDERPVVTVDPFDHDHVRKVAGTLGFDAGALDASQLDLLAVPLNLALLAEIAASSTGRQLDFATRRDLYDAFWKHKRRDVDDRLGRSSRWVEVIDRLVDHMSEQQVLRAPCELVDEWESDADAMASSNVLMSDGRSYAFFHETFFDYLFARRFIARGRSLRQLLVGDQLLFRRAQVRQVLTHERDGDFVRYIKDLAYLIDDATVRFHIKDLVLAWLDGVTVPADDEWRLIRPLLDGADEPLRERAWRLLCSPGWFEYAGDSGAMEEWLAAGDDTGKRARWVIGQVTGAFPQRAAELMSALMDTSEEGRRDVVAILSRTDLATDRAVFELFLRLFDDPLEENGLAGLDFWYIAHGLPEAYPGWGCELLGHYLANRVAAAKATGVKNAFKAGNGLIPPHMHLQDFVTKCAERAPLVFVEYVWPPVLDVINQTAEEFREDQLWRDDLWPLRHYGDIYGDLDDYLLLGLEAAFTGLARDQPARFGALVAEHSDTPHDSVVHLIFRGFAGNPEHFADQAIDFVLADPRRFQVAHSSDSCWGTRQLIAAITPYCSDDALERLTEAIMAFYSSWERSVGGHREHGRAQFCLLGGIAEARRSADVRKRFAELQRKFGEDMAEPLGIRGGTVHSPIPSDAAERMTDQQWQTALARYDDERGRDLSDFLKGGAHQLSSVLEQRTTTDPVRFARIALTLPDDTHPYYFDAILRGVGASDHIVPLNLTCELCLRCHALPERPSGMWIGGPIVRHAEEALPEELIAVLTWYATEAGDSGYDRNATDEDSRAQLEQQGLNSVRGAAATSIAHLVYARKDNLKRLRPAIESLVSDREMAVRAMAARIPLMLLRYHRDHALALFDALVDSADDHLLATRHIEEFLRYRAAIDFVRLRPIMERMVRSELSDVRSAGAAWITLAALSEAGAHNLARACLAGSEQERLGAARVYAGNLTLARYRGRCEDALRALFDDDSAEVRKATSAALTRLDDAALGEFEPLAQEFLGSRAAADDDGQVLLMLTTTTARVPELAVNACEKIIHRLGPDAGDVRTTAARLAGQIIEILIRAYADSDGAPTLRERALDLIDLSLRLNIYGAHRALQEHDRG